MAHDERDPAKHRDLGAGGPGVDKTTLKENEDPALQNESRQSVKNQSKVDPEDYPNRSQTPAPDEKPRPGGRGKGNGQKPVRVAPRL